MTSSATFISQATKMLNNLKGWLEDAEEFAAERGFDADNFVGCRLAPDKFPLSRQVQSSCDTAKMTAARLSGKEVAKHEDAETTMAELKARIDSVVKILDGFSASDFDGSDDRELVLNFLGGATAKGSDYLVEFAQPNFYFHVTMAYAILRHNGVKLGKRRFLGSVTLGPPKA